MNQTVQEAAGTIKCVICSCSPSTMLSFDTTIDVEGIQICCGTMYRRFIKLEESIMVNIRQDRLKLCLVCFTQLNTCYLFQRQALKSAETLLGIKINCNESVAPKVSIIAAPCSDTNDESNNGSESFVCNEEVCKDESNVDQNDDDILMESIEGPTLVVEDEGNNIDQNESKNLELLVEEETIQEEYLFDADELQPEEVIDVGSTTIIEFNVRDANNLEEQAVEAAIQTSRSAEATLKRERYMEQNESGTLTIVRGGAKGTVECSTCALSANTMTSFREHFMKDHCVNMSATKMQCTVCQRNFNGRKSFVQHIVTHQATKPYVCRFCFKSFYYAHHQRNHELTHSTVRPFRCEQCPRTFSTKERLEDHRLQHKSLATHACDVCSMRFKSFKALHKHNLMKHDVAVRSFEPCACDSCGKMLYSQTAATYHARLKCGRITFGPASWYIHCLVCKQLFETRAQLERHLKAKHTAEEHQSYVRQNSNKSLAHECDVCGRKFSQRVVLMRHKLRHEDVKPYQCEHCQRSFAQKGTLKTHLRTHTNERPFLCPACGDSFRSAASLRCHRLRRCINGNALPEEINTKKSVEKRV